MTDVDAGKVVATVGFPDGPRQFVPEFGCEVGTFTQSPEDKLCLKYHVPLSMRGPFRPKDLCNYNEAKSYRTNALGYLLCYGVTATGEKCKRKAVNRFPRCEVHGGALHPLDNLVREQDTIAGNSPESMSRYQQFLAKYITVEDLDDEEVLNFGFRDSSGRIFKPRNIPRELVNEITKAIYDRALHEIKSNAVEAAKTLASIMMDPNNDANIRLKAAESILDRSIGKAPQQLNISAGAPWEEIFESITTATREQSRANRGNIIDAELAAPDDDVVLPDSLLPATTDTDPQTN